jgi:peroxiredoxin Q/BCP
MGELIVKLVLLAVVASIVLIGAAILLKPRIARAEMLKEGEPAPSFDSQMVIGEEVKPVKLSDFLGKKLVLYFYPKDDTPGCTKEACAFRDGFARYQQAGITVLGCSVDSADSHKAFIKKYNLPFPLLLDPDHKIATAYGAANGIPILGLDRRVTYIIDETGKIQGVYPRVDPSVHAGEILTALGADKIIAASASASPAATSTASGSTP